MANALSLSETRIPRKAGATRTMMRKTALNRLGLVGIICATLAIRAPRADVKSSSTLNTTWINAFLKNRIDSIELPNRRLRGLRLNLLEDKNPGSPKLGLSLIWIVMPASQVDWTISEPRVSANANVVFAQTAAREDIIVESGGYFGDKEDGTKIPIGLVVTRGRQTSAKAHWQSGGILVKKNGETKVIPTSAFTPKERITEALQSKPILVKDGMNGILSNRPEFYNRTAVGLDAAGNYICAGAFSDDGHAVSLFEFAELLCRLRETGGPIMRDVLCLDGGPSSHIYIPSIQRHFGYAADRYIPNALRFFSKEEKDAKGM
jgi:phosphodiester glycosidase